MPQQKYRGLDDDEPQKKLPVQEVKPLTPDQGIVYRGLPESGYQTSQQEKLDKTNVWVPPVPAGSVGRGVAEGLPFAGSFYGPGGTMVGTGLKLMLKKQFPGTFGEYSPNIYDQTGEAAKDIAFNNTLPWAIGGTAKAALRIGKQAPGFSFKDLPEIRNNAIQRMTDQIQGWMREGGYRPATGEFQPVDFRERVGPFQPIQPVKMGPGGPVPATPSDIEREIRRLTYSGMEEPAAGERIKIMPKGPINQLEPTGAGIETILTSGVQKGDNYLGDLLSGRRIDAGKALDELLGKNRVAYQDAMPGDGFTYLRGLLETMEKTQATGAQTDKVINYVKGRLIWGLGGAVVGGVFGKPLARHAGPVILNSVLSKIMANPETAGLVIRAMQTPLNSAEGQFLNKALTSIMPRIVQFGADVATVPEK